MSEVVWLLVLVVQGLVGYYGHGSGYSVSKIRSPALLVCPSMLEG